MKLQIKMTKSGAYKPSKRGDTWVVQAVGGFEWKIAPHQTVGYPTGLIIIPPKGYRVRLLQTSACLNYGLVLTNNEGASKHSPNKELLVWLTNNTGEIKTVKGGLELAQISLEKEYLIDEIEVI